MSANALTVAVIEKALPVEGLRQRKTEIQAMINSLMVKDVHFTTIPGSDSRFLTKQGSEMLLTAFHISVEPEIIEKSDEDAVRYTVKVTGRHMTSGIVVGVGTGRCSSNEEKYKWRSAVCAEEFNETPEARRREVWKKGNPAYRIKQVRTNAEDCGNTILKMAKKRAQVDLCLTCLAASDAFKAQPRPLTTTTTKPPSHGAPAQQAAPAASGQRSSTAPAADRQVQPQAEKQPDKPRPATQAQVTLIKRKLDDVGIADNHFLAQFQIGSFEELPFDQVDLAIAWIKGLDNQPPEGT